MSRLPFSQVLKSASVDIRKEYDRLYELFYVQDIADISGRVFTIVDLCEDNFINLPFIGTCLTLDDFDETYGFHFYEDPLEFDLDYLVTFCEYSYNLAFYNQGFSVISPGLRRENPIQHYILQVRKVIEKIGYMANNYEGIINFVPKNQAAIAVAEIIDPSLSYKVIEYNHHSMKGDLIRKKATLLELADRLEPQRSALKNEDVSLADDLFFMFNKVNLRHNNTDPNGSHYNSVVGSMTKEEIEHLNVLIYKERNLISFFLSILGIWDYNTDFCCV